MEVKFCADHGIPPRIFRGAPMPKPGQPLWTEVDQDEIMALLELESQSCPECGTREEEWTEALASGNWAYIAAATKCLGCEAREQEYDNFERHDKGMKVRLLRPDQYAQFAERWENDAEARLAKQVTDHTPSL